MPTTVTRYVNPDSAGGDGTTSALSGSTAAYASLSAAFSAQARDLVGADEIARFVVDTDGSADSTLFTMSGWTTDATRFIEVVGAQPLTGAKYDATKYRRTGTSSIMTLQNTGVFHIKFLGIQFQLDGQTSTGTRYAIQGPSGVSSGSRADFIGCVFSYTFSTATGNHRALRFDDTDYTINVVNCAFLNWTNDGTTCSTLDTGTGSTSGARFNVLNCTFVNCDRGVNWGWTTATPNLKLVNTLFSGVATEVNASGTFVSGTGYNATSSSNTLPGSNNRTSQTFTFEDSGAGDYSLATADAGAKDFGFDLSADSDYAFSTDIAGTTRTGAWDIGASEAASLSGTTFYLKDATASSSNHGSLQLEGSAPSAATTGTGWTVGTVAASNYALMDYGAERTSGAFGATAEPQTSPNNTLGDCWRSESALSGTIAAGDWTLTVPVIAVDAAGGQDGRIRARLWKSSNADGSSATEITSGAVAGTVVTDLGTGSAQNSVVTFSGLSAAAFSNEYLFVQIAWEITGAAS